MRAIRYNLPDVDLRVYTEAEKSQSAMRAIRYNPAIEQGLTDIEKSRNPLCVQ